MKKSFSIGLIAVLVGLSTLPHSSHAWAGYSTGISGFMGQDEVGYNYSNVGVDDLMDNLGLLCGSGVQPASDSWFGSGNGTYGDYPFDLFDLSCSYTPQWVGWDFTSFTPCWPSWSYCDWEWHPWPPCDGHHHPPCIPAPMAMVLGAIGIVGVVALRWRRAI